MLVILEITACQPLQCALNLAGQKREHSIEDVHPSNLQEKLLKIRVLSIQTNAVTWQLYVAVIQDKNSGQHTVQKAGKLILLLHPFYFYPATYLSCEDFLKVSSYITQTFLGGEGGTV